MLSLPEDVEGEAGGEPKPVREGEEGGEGEGKEERGEAQEDDPESAELVALSKIDQEPGERDEADRDEPAGEAEGAREEIATVGDHQPGPRQDGEVGQREDPEDRSRGGAPATGRAAGEAQAEMKDHEREDRDGGWDDDPEE